MSEQRRFYTARMRRLAWTFAARIGDKYQIRLTRPNYSSDNILMILDFQSVTTIYYVMECMSKPCLINYVM